MSQQQIRRPGAPRRRWIRLVIPLLAVSWIILALLGGDDPAKPPKRAESPSPFTVGRGARGAVVIPARGERRRPVVVFLHGWGLVGREAYRPWLDHLASRGSTIIAPRYQTSIRTNTRDVLDNAFAGVRSALRRLRHRPRNLVVVGHSVGGVLAVEYAIRARRLRLPRARAVVSIYPGGAVKGMAPIPQSDVAGLPSATQRLVVFASPRDRLVGTAPAQAIHDGALKVAERRRRLVTVDDPIAGKHFAPVVDSAAARREFWNPVDRLLDGLT